MTDLTSPNPNRKSGPYADIISAVEYIVINEFIIFYKIDSLR